MRILLGDEFDDNLREAVRASLREYGANIVNKTWGVGGSQELEILEAIVGDELITVEAETYIGLSISGERKKVEELAEKVRARLKK